MDAPCEVIGEGAVFTDRKGVLVMHMHDSVGRNGRSVTRCFRGVLSLIPTEFVGKGGSAKWTGC